MEFEKKRKLTEDERIDLLESVEDVDNLEEAIEIVREFEESNPDVDLKDLYIEIRSSYTD